MIRKMGLVVASAALAVGSAALFGGIAFAGGHGSHDHNGAPGASGGKAQSACLIPIDVTAGIVGQGNDQGSCNASGGDGANGATGANY